MLTFQDFEQERDKATFIAKLIREHESSELVRTAREADEYDRQRNINIRNYVQKMYTASGAQMENVVASNNKRACNLFRLMNKQRCAYSLGNGLTFTQEGTKEKLGDNFDTRMSDAGYKALIHGLTFVFLNVDRVHVFPVTEFAPMWDEMTGALRAGVRYWRLGPDKPTTATLYEEDGYSVYIAETGNVYTLAEEKRAYKLQTMTAAADDAPVIVGEENYSALPVVPLWGSELHQSTLVGLKDGIDNYDLISNGWCNDLSDFAQVYWILENYGGMTEADKANFRASLLYQHIATADTQDGGKVTPYTQEVPYAAREAYLNMLRRDIYADFGVLNTSEISASAKTATEINAAYQPMELMADDFEYQIIECVQKLLRLLGIKDTPQFKRDRISNQMEQVEMVSMEATWLDEETILNKLPNVTPDEIPGILERRDANAVANLSSLDKLDDEMDDDGGEE